jgi:hypothetical protein
MKKLLEAFLELPAWQEISLIAAFVMLQAALCWWVAFWGYRRGVLDASIGAAIRGIRDTRGLSIRSFTRSLTR